MKSPAPFLMGGWTHFECTNISRAGPTDYILFTGTLDWVYPVIVFIFLHIIGSVC